MPNHVTNIVRFGGEEKQVEALLEFVKTKNQKGPDDDIEECHLFDFNKIVPRPKELDIVSTFLSSTDPVEIEKEIRDRNERCDAKWKLSEEQIQERINEQVTLAKAYASNIEKYGHKSWYEWSIANWGTKWHCYDYCRHDDGAIQFDTAWSTPEPVIQALSMLFPEIEIHVDFADEDMGNNCGSYSYINGESQGYFFPDGKAAMKFAIEIKGGDPEDYGFDEDFNPIDEDEDEEDDNDETYEIEFGKEVE